MPTILHVSDLHRAPDDPISNDELVSSLLRDLERATVRSRQYHRLMPSSRAATLFRGFRSKRRTIGLSSIASTPWRWSFSTS